MKPKFTFPLLVATVVLFACSQVVVEELEPEVTNSVQTIIDDMRLPHEAKLHGVPDTYDWFC